MPRRLKKNKKVYFYGFLYGVQFQKNNLATKSDYRP
jgi:hypothetical protein